MWPGSPDWPSSQRTHLLPMSAAHVLNNCNDKLATAKLGPNSIATGVTRGQRYYGPLRHPRRPGLSLAGVRLRVTRPHRLGFPVLRWISMYRHAVVITPVARWVLIARGTAYSNRYPFLPSDGGLPHPSARSASTLVVSRPAQRSLALRPVGSLHRQSDTSVSKAPTVSLPPPSLR